MFLDTRHELCSSMRKTVFKFTIPYISKIFKKKSKKEIPNSNNYCNEKLDKYITMQNLRSNHLCTNLEIINEHPLKNTLNKWILKILLLNFLYKFCMRNSVLGFPKFTWISDFLYFLSPCFLIWFYICNYIN